MTPIEVVWIVAHILGARGAVVHLFDGYRSYILGREGFVTNTTPEIPDVQRDLDKRNLKTVPMIKFQITTRGREMRVVERGIRSVIRCAEHVPWKGRVLVDIITEDPQAVEEIHAAVPPAPRRSPRSGSMCSTSTGNPWWSPSTLFGSFLPSSGRTGR